jgi:excisionase family DNA binding protein
MRHIDRDRVPHPKNEVEIAIHHRDGFAPLTVRVPTAVRMTGISRSKIYELIASGDVDIVKIGSATLITFSSLEKLILKNKR